MTDITSPARLDRSASAASEKKFDVDQEEEATPHHTANDRDDDQVGYATFMAAQERGYQPVRIAIQADADIHRLPKNRRGF
jgi:hypothetical protein